MTETERLEQLEGAVGMKWYDTHPVPADLNPENTLPSGRYPLILSDYQLRLAFASALDQIERLEKRVMELELKVPQPANSTTPGAALSNVTPINGSGGDVGFQFETGTVVHRMYANPEDYGFRLWFNYREPYVNGSSSSVPSLPQQYLFFEQDGAISVGYYKPQTAGQGPYDSLPGKGLVFRPGGRNADGTRGQHAMIFPGQVGRGLQLGVCRTDPNYPDSFDFEIDPDDPVNPIRIKVGSNPRKVKIRADGTLYAE